MKDTRPAVVYVRALAEGKISAPDGKPMSSAEIRVLKALASLHNEYIWCAFIQMRNLATMLDMSQSHTRRQITQLVRRGILRRYFVLNERWGEQGGNEYEFVALGEKEVSQQDRDVVLKYKRVRSAIQVPLRRGGRQRKAVAGHAGSTLGVQGDAGSNEQGVSAADVKLDEAIEPGDQAGLAQIADVALDDAATVERVFFVQKSVDVIVGGNHEDCEGQSPRLPVELLKSLGIDLSLSLPSPCAVASVEKAPIIASARTTASAKATATTPVMRAATVSRDSGGSTGTSSGRGELGVERGFESYDEAVQAGVRWVLTHCGISPASANRRQRIAVAEALLLAMNTKGWTLAKACEHGVAMWAQYLEMSWAIFKKVNVRQFFLEGLWLEDRRWDWNQAAIREHRRRQ